MHYFCRKLRSSEPSQLLINLCFGFLGIYIAYIIALHATAVSGLCVLAGVLVHYFLLATFFIMAADAILIVNKLIFVFFKIRRYVAIASIISWCKFVLVLYCSTLCSVICIGFNTMLCRYIITDNMCTGGGGGGGYRSCIHNLYPHTCIMLSVIVIMLISQHSYSCYYCHCHSGS